MMFSGSETSRNTHISLCAATLVTTGALLLYKHKKYSQIKANEEKKDDDSSVLRSHQLSAMESMFYMLDIPPITTLTWFQGDYRTALPKLEERMAQIICKNPWIQGQISVSSYLKGTCYLSFNANDVCTESKLKKFVNAIDPSKSPISRDMPIVEQNSILLNSKLYMDEVFIRNGPKEPFFKATIIPCSKSPDDTFALIVQMSHAIGDGATYYKLMNMLCSTEKANIVELIPERIEQSTKLQIEAMGKMEAGYMTSLGFNCQNMLGMVMNQLKGPLEFDYGFTDTTIIEELKISAAKDAGLPFVSTNDVLTSWLMKYSDSPHGMMAVNLRNRLEGHTELHAGNYENLIFYSEDDYATPGLIRKSLESLKRFITKDKNFPSWWEVASTKVSCVTNWMTFSLPNVIEGCVEDLHFPMIKGDLVPCHRFRMFVIFRAGVDKVGFCFAPGALSSEAAENDPFGLTRTSK